jgi:catechol 2,3-dioxygenase-like lactoylglutathione lyase family enzyme
VPATGILHHVELYVSDLSRSLAFWGWLLGQLGYQQYQDWPEGRSYKLDATYLVFVQTESGYLDVPYHRKRTGLNHLAFWVSRKEEFEKLVQGLAKRQVSLLYPDKQGLGSDYHAIFFEDPDRIKVELVLDET